MSGVSLRRLWAIWTQMAISTWWWAKSGAARGALRAVPAVRPDGLAIDPTGAGDAFAAGFLAGLLGVGLSGADPQVAAQSAVRLAAQAVRVIGGRGRG